MSGGQVLEGAIRQIVAGGTLDRELARATMHEIMAGRASDPQIAALLVGLAVRGETTEEITGFAHAMREHAVPVVVDTAVVDTCGTGGSGTDCFNVSTAAAFVVAAAGVPVAKHGNRAVSSTCGSADVLEELGAAVELTPEGVSDAISHTNIGFMFAPAFHPAMRHVMPVRRALGIRTVFNFLGPLTNPAGARRQVLGVSDRAKAAQMVEVLKELGSERALVVHAPDHNLDELSVCGPTLVWELDADGHIDHYEITPDQFGLGRAELTALAGGDRATSAQIVRDVLSGAPDARLDVVLLNAAAALVVADAATDIETGIAVAREAIVSGAALDTLARYVAVTTGQIGTTA